MSTLTIVHAACDGIVPCGAHTSAGQPCKLSAVRNGFYGGTCGAIVLDIPPGPFADRVAQGRCMYHVEPNASLTRVLVVYDAAIERVLGALNGVAGLVSPDDLPADPERLVNVARLTLTYREWSDPR